MKGDYHWAQLNLGKSLEHTHKHTEIGEGEVRA